MTLDLTRRNVKGSPLTATDHDTNLDKLETAITTPLVRGQISKTTTATIPITTTGEYVTTGVTGVLDTTTANGLSLGTTDTFALRNTSGSTHVVRVYGSIDARDGSNLVLGIKMALNGTPIDETECRASTAVAGQEAKLVTSWLVTLEDGDEIALFIANHTSTADLEFRRGRIVATEVR